MLLCPLLVIYTWTACTNFNCSMVAPVEAAWAASDPVSFIRATFPQPTLFGFQLYFGWLAFQAFLYTFLPGKLAKGQMTPAGHILEYVVNGLAAWVVTHALFIGGSLIGGYWSPALIFDNWGGILVAANVYGYALTAFSFWKANYFPSHPGDRKYSNSSIYDLFMGIEFNPRIGKYFDFKLFHNGRPGIIAWTLVNFSFAAAQYREIGYVTNSMCLLNFFHFVYVIDFFICEDWYLRTIDIAHDHFGFYLSWGDTVWLPFMYTLQSHFLARHQIDLSWPYFAFVLGTGLAGYYIFRTVNNQKDLVRLTDGKCKIWGKPAKVIRTEFTTGDGKVHRSLLLVSGFWGLARHVNYLGDLILSLCMCLTCGFGYLLPYFYICFMGWLLMDRIGRDQKRCHGKYGKYWDQYCQKVPYKLIPYVW